MTKSFTSIQIGDEKIKVPSITSRMLTEIAAKWQCSKATAAEIIIARMHGHEFPDEQAVIKEEGQNVLLAGPGMPEEKLVDFQVAS